MRPRFVVLASLLAALAALVAPALGSAAPRHNHGLTINVTPNPIFAGDAVLIYGQLNNSPVAGQRIVLYHRVAGSSRGYTQVAQTTTNAEGFYSFPRAENVVTTDRSWFTREAGLHGVHSRTVYERVQSLVTLSASTTTQDTSHPIAFTGNITPARWGQRVLLQQQRDSSDDWRTLETAWIGHGSSYTISHRWRIPGNHDVRVVVRSNATNDGSASDPVNVTIQQAQVPGFTVNTSAPIIDYGQGATITGVLSQANTAVTLFKRSVSDRGYEAVANTTTGSDGSYAFAPQTPGENTLYQVRATYSPSLRSAVLFEGVRDVVTLTASSTSTVVGAKVTFLGTVLPDKAGRRIYLQRLGADGDWHFAAVQRISNASSFQFGWRFGAQRTKTFRARIISDGRNIGGASAPVTITVGAAPTASLPPAS